MPKADRMMPDTLDLASRAEMVLTAMGGCIDQKLMTMYGAVHICCPRPHLAHWASADTLLDPKFGESFALMRLMCGGKQHSELEAAYRRDMLNRIDNGLYWNRYDPARPWRNSYAPKFYGKGKDEDFCTLPGAGRMARSLMIWNEIDGDEAWNTHAQQLISGMRRIAVCREDYCYYPERGGWGEPCSYPRSGWLNTDEAKSETEGGEGSVTCMHGHQLYAAANWYVRTGDADAKDLARRLANYCMKPKFWGGLPDPDGNREGLPDTIAPRRPEPAYFAGEEQGHWYSHFHARAIALRGILEYARLMEDERAMEFVRRAYEFTLTQGIARIGWVNCCPVTVNGMEGCALGDLVAMGIRLSDAGAGDYWDDVDAIVRNQLVEQQLTRADLLEKVAAAHTKQCCEDAPASQLSHENTIARTVGFFGGFSLPTSFPWVHVMHCCTANASQGLYYAWEGTLRETADTAQVNLLLNRFGRLVDVESHLPYEGRLVIRNKAARRVAVRIPAWVWRRELRADVSGKPRKPDWVGKSLVFEALKAGDVVTITFPVRETTASYTINAHSAAEQVFACTFRGSTLVDITPRDNAPKSYPLYLRDHMRSDKTPMTAAKSYVPERIVSGW